MGKRESKKDLLGPCSTAGQQEGFINNECVCSDGLRLMP